MFCAKCGNEIREGSRFCGKCGAPIAAEVSKTTEPQEVHSSATLVTTKSADEWYYVGTDGESHGPVGIQKLKGQISSDTMVWKEGLSDWVKASETELNSLFSTVCAACGAELNSGDRFCGRCGTIVGGVGVANGSVRTVSLRYMVLNFTGCLFYMTGLVDFAGMFAKYDITGVSWSPIVFGGIGAAIMSYASKFKLEAEQTDAKAEKKSLENLRTSFSKVKINRSGNRAKPFVGSKRVRSATLSTCSDQGAGNTKKGE